MMSKKNYVALAAAVKDALRTTPDDPLCRNAIHQVALNMSRVFRDDNPNFNHARFIAACGTVEG